MKSYTEQELHDLISWEMWTDEKGFVTIRGDLLLSAQEVVDPYMIRQTDLDLQEHIREELAKAILHHCWTAERQKELDHLRDVKVEAFKCVNVYSHTGIHEGVLYGRKL